MSGDAVRTTFPTYKRLQSMVKSTFTAEAAFLPHRIEVWSSLPGETPQKRVRKRSDYLAHSTIKLAVGREPDIDELQLSTCYTHDLYQAVVVVDKTRWAEGFFEVMSFDPEIQDCKVILQKWTNLEFKVKWGGKTIGCQAVGKFHAEGTKVKQSLLESAATVFLKLLSAEFPS
ncbi:hypothetical protein ABBQ38_005781 [Trebouxia sp. C0009 RCD-2024]